MGGFCDTVVLGCIRGIIMIYDMLTLPIYTFVQRPWRTLDNSSKPRARLLSSSETQMTWESTTPLHPLQTEMQSTKLNTLDKVINFAMNRNEREQRSLGTRVALRDEEVLGKDGRMFRKFMMGEYRWLTYGEVRDTITLFGKGLKELGLNELGRICIFAETRAEWLLTAMSAFQHRFTIVTLYATLGEDAIAHGIEETECPFIVTSFDNLPKLRNVMETNPSIVKHIKGIIYMEDQLRVVEFEKNLLCGVPVYPFKNVLRLGQQSSKSGSTPANPDDIAVIMYTSGTTGAPKGVLLSHFSVASSVISLVGVGAPTQGKHGMAAAYLPLAHVFEMTVELTCLVVGEPIGYSSPLTMMTGGGKLIDGCVGDIPMLRPTMLIMVPLVLDRISKVIHSTIEKRGSLAKALFSFFFSYRLRWWKKGYRTPILDKLVFAKIRNVVGGRVVYIQCGSAPVAPETEEFVRNCFGVNPLQGYGCTESSGSGTNTNPDDMAIGCVGVPLCGCQVRLIDWKEGKYTLKDKPSPRGEIVFGGDFVAVGYYKQPDEKNLDFFVEGGKRWFKTGDIGEVNANGVLKIIDRKKDLVKLQTGEYISPGKVEAALKSSPFIDDICIHGDPSKYFCVALVVPAFNELSSLAATVGKGHLTLEQLSNDPQIEKLLLNKLREFGEACKLSKLEIPAAITICSDVWTPDSGLVTPAFKIKRKPIQDRYKKDIERMYA